MGKRFKAAILALTLGLGTILAMGQTTIYRARSTAGYNLLFTPDNTYDIGAVGGVSRPKSIYTASTIFIAPGANLRWSDGAGGASDTSAISSPSDGVLLFMNNAGTDFTRLQFGGTTSSFPALKRSTTSIQVRLADDSALGNFQAQNITGTAFFINPASPVLLMSTTAPTISSGFGTSATIANNNGTAAFTVNVGTGGTATTGVIGLPTATTGWNCWVRNLTAQAAHIADRDTRQVASTTTTASIENQIVSTGATVGAPWAASDILRVSCFAY